MSSLLPSRQAAALAAAPLLLLAFSWFAPSARAYNLEGPQWPANKPITLQLQLGASGVLLDGSASWGASAEDALARWNAVLGDVQFNVVENSTVPIAQGDGLNSAFFSTTAFGTAFGSGTLGLTLYSYKISPTGAKTFTEADVVFNSTQPFNSYSGALHNVVGSLLWDFHRVALHEFGHLLGLDHALQTDAAIMTPFSTNIDTIQPDDIAGVQSLYGAPAAVTPTPTPTPTPVPGATPAPTPTPAPNPTPTPVVPQVAALAVSATASWADGVQGRFTISRTSGDMSKEMVVNYSVSGNAQPGVDYVRLNGTAKIKPGKAAKNLMVTALRETGGRKVKITILPGDGYEVTGTKAKVKIQ